MNYLSRYSKILFWMIALSSLYSLLATPPFQSPDERDHFKRIVQIGSGRTSVAAPSGETSGDHIDKSVMRAMEPFMHLPFNKENRVDRSHFKRAYEESEFAGETEFSPFPGSLSYAPWSYPGQVLGYVTSCGFTNNMLLRFYASRLAGLVLALLLLYTALRLLPIERWPLLSLILVSAPFAMFQMGSAVPDSLLISGTVLFCAGCAAVREKRLHAGYLALLAFLIFLIVGSKPPVALFFALVLASLFESSSKRSVIIFVLVSVTLLLLATALWFSYALPRIADLSTEGGFPLAKELKKAAVMDEPIRYFMKGLQVFFGMIWGYYSSLYGQMGWLDATISKPHMAVGRILFVWAIFVSLIPLGVRCPSFKISGQYAVS